MNSSSNSESHGELSDAIILTSEDANIVTSEGHGGSSEEKKNKKLQKRLLIPVICVVLSLEVGLFSAAIIFYFEIVDYFHQEALAAQMSSSYFPFFHIASEILIKIAFYLSTAALEGIASVSAAHVLKTTCSEVTMSTPYGYFSGRATFVGGIFIGSIGAVASAVLLGTPLVHRILVIGLGSSYQHGGKPDHPVLQSTTDEKIDEIHEVDAVTVSKLATIGVSDLRGTALLVRYTSNTEASQESDNADVSFHSVTYETRGTNSTGLRFDGTVNSFQH